MGEFKSMDQMSAQELWRLHVDSASRGTKNLTGFSREISESNYQVARQALEMLRERYPDFLRRMGQS